MTESRIPRDLVRAIAIEYTKESKRLGGEIDGLSNALDAHLDELAALVQPDEPSLPRLVVRSDVRPGQIIEVRYRYEVASTASSIEGHDLDWQGAAEWWLIKDAPEDVALVDALAEAIAADDGRPLGGRADEVRELYRGNARAALAALRERCDITPRGEQ